ncbi:MAG: DUF1634 domain-containing protein [Candidatus Omnitrophica bacterium]|nr:DUF1634 domain-containing protein [Candidatus Omnitrophota bacterium]
MTNQKQKIIDGGIEVFMGNLLRAGVIIAATLVILGGVIYMFKHGFTMPDYKNFYGEPQELRHPVKIFKYAFSLHGRGMVQLGLLALIATPIARVVFSVFVFFRERDKLYLAITCIVLAVLCYSLFGGR